MSDGICLIGRFVLGGLRRLALSRSLLAHLLFGFRKDVGGFSAALAIFSKGIVSVLRFI